MKLSKRVKALVIGAVSVVAFLAAAPMIGGASLSHELGPSNALANCSSIGGRSTVGGKSTVGRESCTGPPTLITLSSTSLTGHGIEKITGTQFVVGEKVNLYVTSDSGKLKLLGEVKAKTGSFKTTVTIAGVTAGTHTVVAAGSKHSFASVNFEMLPEFVVVGGPVKPGAAVKSKLAAFRPKSTLKFFLFRKVANGYCPATLPPKAVTLATSPSTVVTGSKGESAGTAKAGIVIPVKTGSGKYTIEVHGPADIGDCAGVSVK